MPFLLDIISAINDLMKNLETWQKLLIFIALALFCWIVFFTKNFFTKGLFKWFAVVTGADCSCFQEEQTGDVIIQPKGGSYTSSPTSFAAQQDLNFSTF